MADARAAALAALLHVDENEGFSNLVLDKTLAQFALEPRDAALASAIFYGVDVYKRQPMDAAPVR